MVWLGVLGTFESPAPGRGLGGDQCVLAHPSSSSVLTRMCCSVVCCCCSLRCFLSRALLLPRCCRCCRLSRNWLAPGLSHCPTSRGAVEEMYEVFGVSRLTVAWPGACSLGRSLCSSLRVRYMRSAEIKRRLSTVPVVRPTVTV